MRAAVVAALAAALLAAAPAGAEVRRYAVVGAVPIDPEKPLAVPRQAALQAALREAVALAARGLVQEATGTEPTPDANAAAPTLPGAPSEFVVSYRVLEDRGEQDRLPTVETPAGQPAGPAGREYVLLAEVQIDLDRVREGLESAGTLVSEAAAPRSGPFRLEILGIPSPATWTAVREALSRAGARTVVPVEIEAGRALVDVDAALGPERTLALVVPRPLPDGLGLESLGFEAGLYRVRVRPLPPPAPEPLLEHSPGAPLEGAPEIPPGPPVD